MARSGCVVVQVPMIAHTGKADQRQAADQPDVVAKLRGDDLDALGLAAECVALDGYAGRAEEALTLPGRDSPADDDALRVEDVDDRNGGRGKGLARALHDLVHRGPTGQLYQLSSQMLL